MNAYLESEILNALDEVTAGMTVSLQVVNNQHVHAYTGRNIRDLLQKVLAAGINNQSFVHMHPDLGRIMTIEAFTDGVMSGRLDHRTMITSWARAGGLVGNVIVQVDLVPTNSGPPGETRPVIRPGPAWARYVALFSQPYRVLMYRPNDV